MKITDALRGEHAVFYAQFDRIETAVDDAGEAEIRAMAELLAAALVTHAAIEDDLLFRAMERAPEQARGPLAAMREEHEDIEGMLTAAAGAPGAERAAALVRDAVALAREHFAREELMLFPAAEDALGDAVLEELGGEWGARRRVALGAAARRGP